MKNRIEFSQAVVLEYLTGHTIGESFHEQMVNKEMQIAYHDETSEMLCMRIGSVVVLDERLMQ